MFSGQVPNSAEAIFSTYENFLLGNMSYFQLSGPTYFAQTITEISNLAQKDLENNQNKN